MTTQTETKEEVKVEAQDEGQMHIDFKFIAPGNHTWRQRGPYVVCLSCEVQHAIYVGIDKVMTGVRADTTPILAKR